eukprot:gene20413-27195_t
MQALRQAVRAYIQPAGTRGVSSRTAEDTWAKHFPVGKQESAGANKKAVRKELLGFFLLGPLGAGFMLYDFIIGLEEENHHVIPPYPWMRMRRYPGMPWGDDCLFESHPRVASSWPPEEGEAEEEH